MATKEVLSVQRLPFYIFLIVLGVLASTLFYFTILSTDKSRFASSGHEIEKKDAKQYQKNYRDSKDGLLERINRLETEVNSKTELLRGFLIDKSIIDSINAIGVRTKQGINGYIVFFGKIPKTDSTKKHYTLLIRGIPEIGASKLKGAALSKEKVEESYFDKVLPCPSNCDGEAD